MDAVDKHEDVLCVIDGIRDKIDFYMHRLLDFSKDSDDEIRLRALEVLRCIRNPETEERILRGLSDSDEIIRTTCLEILGSWKDKDFADEIIKCMSDESWLVRSEAAVALSEIRYGKASELIRKKIPEAADEERVSYYYALYKLGEYEYFSLFLNGLFHEFYRIRCATANLLVGIAEPSNRLFLANLLSSALKTEKTEAAASSFKNAINDISEIAKEDDKL